MSNEEFRLNKYMAAAGICSRREADRYIEEGLVRVNGQVAVSGQKVTDADVVMFNGQQIKRQQDHVYLAFNKPVGVVVSHKDDHAATLIFDVLDYPERLTYAGRLDKDSEGLIILTNDGDFVQKAMRAANGHEKEYMVVLDKEPTDEDIAVLSRGILIKELDRHTRPCVIKRAGKKCLTMIITEGMNRQIRRMWAQVGYEVTKLKRLRVINIKLGDLKPLEYRKIQGDELKTMLDMVLASR